MFKGVSWQFLLCLSLSIVNIYIYVCVCVCVCVDFGKKIKEFKWVTEKMKYFRKCSIFSREQILETNKITEVSNLGFTERIFKKNFVNRYFLCVYIYIYIYIYIYTHTQVLTLFYAPYYYGIFSFPKNKKYMFYSFSFIEIALKHFKVHSSVFPEQITRYNPVTSFYFTFMHIKKKKHMPDKFVYIEKLLKSM